MITFAALLATIVKLAPIIATALAIALLGILILYLTARLIGKAMTDAQTAERMRHGGGYFPPNTGSPAVR